MREVVDKITAQHFCVIQFFCRPIETFFYLLEGGMVGNRLAEMQSRLEVAACQPVKLIDNTLDWF